MENPKDPSQIFKKYGCIICTKVPFIAAEYDKMNVNMQDIRYIFENLDDFLSFCDNKISRSFAVLKLSELVVRFGLVDKFEEDRDFGPEDFPDTAKNAVICFTILKLVLKEIPLLEKKHKYQFFVQALLLCATHSETHHWTSSNSLSSCQEYLSALLEFCHYQNLSSLLLDESFNTTVFKGVLTKIRHSLMKETWMLNPSSCYMFYWFLSHVKHPYLVDYLQDIFPPPFMFVAHHAVPYQVLGIQCLDHLLSNIAPTEIKLNGRENVIYHTLYPLSFSRELEIIKVMFPCLLKVPKMTSKKPNLEYWGEFDNIFRHMLFIIEMENKLDVRRIYLSHILSYVEFNPPFKHLKRIMSVIKKNLSYDEFPDEICQITSLKILKEVIKSCWPRMENYCFDILVQILELHVAKEKEGQPRTETDKLSEDCLTLLKHSCREKFESITADYIEDPNMPGVDFLRNAINKD